MAPAKIIRFPLERREVYTGFDKDRWFREAVDEIITGMDEFFEHFDIFSGRRKKPARKK
ncbi:MAG: hypothetical protein ACM3NT_07535 [Methylocystaceae bacterium]